MPNIKKQILMPDNKSVLYFFFNSIKPFKHLVISQLVISLLLAIDMSLRPYFIKLMLDRISTSSDNINSLLIPAIFFILASLINLVVIRISAIVWSHLNSNLKQYICLYIMNRMFQHSHNFYLNNASGNIASKIKDVMSGIPDLAKIMFEKLFCNALMLLIAVYTLFKINLIFGMILSFWSIIYLTFSIIISKYGEKYYQKAAEARSKVVGFMMDVISNMLNVRLFNSAEFEKNLLNNTLEGYIKRDRDRDKFAMNLLTIQGLSFVAYQAICMYFLLVLSISNKITQGDFALVLSLNLSVVGCLWSFSREYGACTALYGDLDQALNNLLSVAEIKNHEEKELIVTQGKIVFENVYFCYEERPKYVLRNSSIVIQPKQKVGLVGISGVGKTTFVNLILRLFDTQSGRILIDDQDIRLVTQESLRKAIAFIPQDPVLFYRSLRDNIAYGIKDIEDTKVINAAKAAYADDFIAQLPEGYNSIVGERGIKLSGGQRQRIAIARVFLRNSPILIIDEATSHLDVITEQNIKSSIKKLMNDKTTIIIAHRLSTLVELDRILVLDNNGQIIEDGSHEQLIAQQGIYYQLWQINKKGEFYESD